METKRILIVEDSVDLQTLLKRLFIKKGYAVVGAENGKTALDYLESGAGLPDVILLDLMMPVMDGHEFHRHQRASKEFAEIPVILMTAHGNVAAEKTDMHLFESLQKPVDMDRLLDLVSRAVA